MAKKKYKADKVAKLASSGNVSDVAPTDRVLFDEISVTGSNIYKVGGMVDFNPDDLVGKKGLEIYRKMMMDDQVKAVLTMKKFSRLMTNWEIQPASTDEVDVEIADFVKDNIDNLPGTFEDNLLNILTGLEYGFSITEEVWYQIEKGEWAGMIGLKDLKTREPFQYAFDSDEFGNLKPDGIVFQGIWLPSSPPTTTSTWAQQQVNNQVYSGQRYPTNKFIIYSYNKEFSNWFGKSDLRAAYRSWWSKEVLIRFMNIYMERFGMPTHVATFPKGTKKEDKEDLKSVLDKVQAKYSIVIPEDIKINLLQSASGGEVGYRTAIEMHNRFIARSILVPDLMGFTEATGGGSYALGKKHFDIFLWILKKLGKDIEESIVGEQLIKRLVDLNYPNVEQYPKFKFEDITEEGTQTKAMIVAAGVQSGFIDPTEPWIRNYLALPKVDENAVLGNPASQPQLGGIGEIGGTPNPDGTTTNQDGSTTYPDGTTVSPEGEVISSDSANQFSRVTSYINKLKKQWTFVEKDNRRYYAIPADFKKAKKKDFQETTLEPTKFEKKENYIKVKKELDDYENETVDALSAIVKRQKEALVKDITRKRIFEDNKLSDVNKIQLKFVGDFKREMELRLIKLFLDSKLDALKMMVKGGADIELRVLFQEEIVQPWEPVPPTEAIDFFNRKVLAKVVTADGTKTLIELATGSELSYYAAKAFAIAGIERDYILKQAKGIILEGLKNGNWKDAIFNMESLFDGYLKTGELRDEELVAPYRLETIVRTNFSEALNSGRRAMYSDPDVKDFVPYWQYTAIMDDRVRPTHADMHGRIYKANDPIWDVILPPNGFNCRCSVIPITTAEVNNEVKSGSGIQISSYRLPDSFPDTGFIKYTDEIKYKQAHIEPMPVEKEDGQKEVPIKETIVEPKVIEKVIETRVVEKESPEKVKLVESLIKSVEEAKKTAELLEKKYETSQVDKKLLQDKIASLERAMVGLPASVIASMKDLLVKENQVVPKEEPKNVDGYDWVVRCPYRGCGSSDIKSVEKLKGAFVYECHSCNHDFKVLQEGDVYFYDVGKEEWVSGEFSMRPSYFRVNIKGKVYTFENIDDVSNLITEENTKGTPVEDMVIQQELYTGLCPYTGCGSGNLELKSFDEYGTTELKCRDCLNKFKVTREGDIYLYEKVKDEWRHILEKMKPLIPNYFTIKNIGSTVIIEKRR